MAAGRHPAVSAHRERVTPAIGLVNSAEREVRRVLVAHGALLPVHFPAVPAPGEALENGDIEDAAARDVRALGIRRLDQDRVALRDDVLLARALERARGERL